MNEGLEALLDLLDGAIIGPDVSLEAEACFHVNLVLIIKQHHALSNVASCILEPLLAELGDMNEDGAHLPCLHREHWYSIAMDTLDLDHTERSFVIRPQQHPLVLSEHAFVDDTSQDEVTLLLEGLRNVELASGKLFLLSLRV